MGPGDSDIGSGVFMSGAMRASEGCDDESRFISGWEFGNGIFIA